MAVEVPIYEEIRDAVTDLDNKCRNCCSGLFFANGFQPKKPSCNADDVTQFWYAVTDLYGLFYDCAPYIFRSHKQYQNLEYISQNSETLLEIMVNQSVLENDEKKGIKNYIRAIGELRSCFCHNKTKVMFNHTCISNSFTSSKCDWVIFPHLGKESESNFDYTIGLDLLQKKTKEIFITLTNSIDELQKKITNEEMGSKNIVYPTDILEPWAQAIAAWYLQSHDIQEQCLRQRYDLLPPGLKGRRFDKLEEWRHCLSVSSVKKYAIKRKKDLNEFLVETHEELAGNILISPNIAKPEILLKDFFDDMILSEE